MTISCQGYYLKLHFSSFDPAWEVRGTAVLAGHLKVTFMFCSFLPGNQLLPKPYSRKSKKVIQRQTNLEVSRELRGMGGLAPDLHRAGSQPIHHHILDTLAGPALPVFYIPVIPKL